MSKLIITNNYGVVPNHILNDPNLSLKAKGLFAFLQSKPSGWRFSVERIASQVKEGRDAVRRTLQELEKAGYLQRKIAYNHEKKKINGYDYILQEHPKTNPQETNPTENQSTGLPEDISNKDNSKKEIVKKNNILRAKAREGNKILNLLEDKKKHIQIIGLYAKAKNITFENKEQQQSFIRRNLRPAKNLIGYPAQRIINTMDYLRQNADYKWTLETVGKFIDENLDTLYKDDNAKIDAFLAKYRTKANN